MRRRELGSTGCQVGEIGLGCMGMSAGYGPSRQDRSESIRVLRRAIDLGVILIDTADVYGPFANEELVGEALSGRRPEVTLATKGGLVAGGDRMVRNGRPEHVRKACDASLRRLRTDVIDLYYLHRVDPEIPIEELERADAIHPVHRGGRRPWGSHWRSGRLAHFNPSIPRY